MTSLKTDVELLTQPKERNQKNIAKNRTDLEERVGPLEDQMAVVQDKVSEIRQDVAQWLIMLMNYRIQRLYRTSSHWDQISVSPGEFLS